jgi:hypothetical protein
LRSFSSRAGPVQPSVASSQPLSQAKVMFGIATEIELKGFAVPLLPPIG